MTSEELKALVEEWVKTLLTTWVAEMGSISATGAITSVLQQAITDAYLQLVNATSAVVETVKAQYLGIEVSTDYRLDRFKNFLNPVLLQQGFPQVQLALKQITEQAKSVDTAINDFKIEQSTMEAKREAESRGPGWGVVWVAHRDCCIRCLAYSGLVVPSDGVFPGGLSFRPSERKPDAPSIPGPPLHPNERCHLEVIYIPESRQVSEALRREARRSAARGWSLPSESDKARREAARFVINSGAFLPKSVIENARRRLGKTTPFRRPVP